MNINEIQNIEIGTPATLCIGSDSYARMVVEVGYFKTGARAGQIRYVIAEPAEYIDGVLVNYSERQDRFIPNKFGKLKCGSCSLYIGTATDYRDPSF
jgi:hypothetical protein